MKISGWCQFFVLLFAVMYIYVQNNKKQKKHGGICEDCSLMNKSNFNSFPNDRNSVLLLDMAMLLVLLKGTEKKYLCGTEFSDLFSLSTGYNREEMDTW
jgi:predicted HTH transcriptional regulator